LCRLFVECDAKAKSRRGGHYGALMYHSGRSTHVLQPNTRRLEWLHIEAAFNWQTHMLDLSVNGSFWRLPFSAYPLSSVYIRNVRGAGTSAAASDFGDIEVDYCRMSDRWDNFNELGEFLPYSWYRARLLYPYEPCGLPCNTCVDATSVGGSRRLSIAATLIPSPRTRASTSSWQDTDRTCSEGWGSRPAQINIKTDPG